MTAALGGEPVTGVLFDYGETLVTFKRPDVALDGAYARIADLLRRRGYASPPGEVLLHSVHDRTEDAFAEHQRSGRMEEINLVALAAQAYADLGLPLDAETLDETLRIEQEAWWQGVTVDPEAVSTLDTLRSRGLRVGLCSNAPYRVRSMLDQLAHVGLDRHLDAITFSGQVGWRKPSPRIFEAATAALGVTAAATVMVGDSARDDIAGAAAAGIRAIWLRRGPAATAQDEPPGAAAAIAHLSAISVLLFGTPAL
ncbi:MAG: HAD family hydrolase [Candidatus Dormibacteria bacterium]